MGLAGTAAFARTHPRHGVSRWVATRAVQAGVSPHRLLLWDRPTLVPAHDRILLVLPGGATSPADAAAGRAWDELAAAQQRHRERPSRLDGPAVLAAYDAYARAALTARPPATVPALQHRLVAALRARATSWSTPTCPPPTTTSPRPCSGRSRSSRTGRIFAGRPAGAGRAERGGRPAADRDRPRRRSVRSPASLTRTNRLAAPWGSGGPRLERAPRGTTWRTRRRPEEARVRAHDAGQRAAQAAEQKLTAVAAQQPPGRRASVRPAQPSTRTHPGEHRRPAADTGLVDLAALR